MNLSSIPKAIAKALDKTLDFLPEAWAKNIRSVRKAIAAGAGALVGLLAYTSSLPLPASWGGAIAGVSVVATAIATYLIPNGGA